MWLLSLFLIKRLLAKWSKRWWLWSIDRRDDIDRLIGRPEIGLILVFFDYFCFGWKQKISKRESVSMMWWSDDIDIFLLIRLVVLTIHRVEPEWISRCSNARFNHLAAYLIQESSLGHQPVTALSTCVWHQSLSHKYSIKITTPAIEWPIRMVLE